MSYCDFDDEPVEWGTVYSARGADMRPPHGAHLGRRAAAVNGVSPFEDTWRRELT
jgi:hypothetical protein